MAGFLGSVRFPVIWAVAVLVLTVVVSKSSSVDASGDYLGWIPIRSDCKGSISECLAGEEVEFQLDSEISRRILQTTKYISYGALQRNTVPCSRRGASYYNCQPQAQANPYTRGCSAITKCRR